MATKTKAKRFIKILLPVAFIILSINILQIPELIKCERLTKLYGEQFENPDMYPEDSSWTHDILDVKVMEHTPHVAKVYCICDYGFNDYGTRDKFGTIAIFRKNTNGTWEFERDSVRWSDLGNLGQHVFMPYWWHNFPKWLID